ncbi:hypothetical protein AMTRI_Chr07g27690 [Amborella trichopoda]
MAATALHSHRLACYGLNTSFSLYPRKPIFSLFLANPTFSVVSTVSSYASSNSNGFSGISSALDLTASRSLHLSRASAGELPNELIEDPKFVPLNADDPRYGPPALLLLGFELEESSKIAKNLPRICFFSGLSGEEMMMFIDSFPETGLEPAVFAALVPNSANKLLAELIEEIMGDHERLTADQSSTF